MYPISGREMVMMYKLLPICNIRQLRLQRVRLPQQHQQQEQRGLPAVPLSD